MARNIENVLTKRWQTMRRIHTGACDALCLRRVKKKKKKAKALVCVFLIVCHLLLSTFSLFLSVVSTSPAVDCLFSLTWQLTLYDRPNQYSLTN